MKTEIKEIYKCDHCNKLYQIKRFSEYHEKICRYNPANNRSCYGCNFFTKKEIEVSSLIFDGFDWSRKVNLFYCNKKRTFLYPPKNGIKGNVYDLGDEANEPMPVECDLFEEPSNNIF